MSLRKQLSLREQLPLFMVLMAMGTTSVWANVQCERLGAKTVSLNMKVGKVVVNPDLPVGATITTRSWPMRVNGRYNYHCWGYGNVVFKGKIVPQHAGDIGNKVYSTNVPGIGMRFSRGGGKVNIIYPGSYSARPGYFSLEGSTFTLEIIKTAAVTGSGPLAAGQYTTYDWERGNNPLLETYLTANAITVVSPSCTVVGGKNMDVDVGTIKRSDLNGIGSTAGRKDFDIKLKCNGGMSESGVVNIQTSFSGRLAPGTWSNQGVLQNEKSGNSLARGVGIQVVGRDGRPLVFDKKISAGELHNNETTYITIPLRARFYQYKQDTSTGEVESHMIFNLTYD